MLCGRVDLELGVVGIFGVFEQLAAEVLQTAQRPRRHGDAAPTTALTVEHGPDQGDATALAGKPADHLGPSA